MVDLSTIIHELELKNPVCTASGTFGYGEEFADFFDPGLLGSIFIKGLTLKNRDGNPYPRMASTAIFSAPSAPPSSPSASAFSPTLEAFMAWLRYAVMFSSVSRSCFM